MTRECLPRFSGSPAARRSDGLSPARYPAEPHRRLKSQTSIIAATAGGKRVVWLKIADGSNIGSVTEDADALRAAGLPWTSFAPSAPISLEMRHSFAAK